MRKQLFIVVLVLSLGGCGFSPMQKLDLSDSAVEQTFSPKEVEGVNKIIRFMDSTAFSGCSCNDVVHAYANLRYAPEIFSQPQFDKLIASMKQLGLYQSFWTVQHDNDSAKSVYLNFNMNGKLFKLIERLSDNDEVAREYYGYLMRDKDISPALVAMFPTDFPEIDVSRPAVRLLIASHLIFLRESEKYSKKKPIPLRLQDMDND